jgi:ATP-binding cassette, subfamily B (MDR/TAP), member 1
LTLFDNLPKIDFWSEKGEVVDKIDGDVELKDVHFRYATRKHVPVLRGLNLRIKPGQYAALVGISGSGKSTIVSLIERFYDVLSGQVLVDGKDISTLNIRSYRQHLALVSQEPTLYQGSIRENVLLGAASKDVPQQDIEAACRQANIHDFIVSLPQGYNTDCGAKGVQLSGGQKQRIAIARALIRNPKILLLDEATSALDSSSEKVVQEALDQAAKGRTTIAVAHRLSTIQKADIIYVLDQGVVYTTLLILLTSSAESGTHDELYALKGRYFEMVQAQALEKRD